MNRGDRVGMSRKYTSHMEDPMLSPGKKVTMKEVIKIINPDKHVMEFYMQKDAKDPEFKFMEITYSRADSKG